MRFGSTGKSASDRDGGILRPLLRLARRRSFLAASASVVAVIAIACGGGGDSGSTSSSSAGPQSTTAPQAFNPDGSAATGSGGAAAPVSTGNSPDLKLDTFAHGPFSLDDLAGKAVVINFWFPSCPPCRAEMPDLQAASEKYRDQDVEFVGVQLLGLDTVEDGKDFLKEVGVTYRNGPDTKGQIIRNFKVTGFPTTFFLDRNHDVSKKWTGILDNGRIDKEIAIALAR